MKAGAATGEKAPAKGGREIVVALEIDLCKACGICIALCPKRVFDSDAAGYPVIAREQDCTRCLLCEFHCPDFALEVARPTPKRARKAAADAEAMTQAESDGVYTALATGRDEHGRQVECGHDEEG